MFYISLFIGKIILRLMQLTGRGGHALSGLVVEKLNRQFLEQSLAQLPKGVVLVTGTNGKTTTTKVLAQLLTAHGYRVLSNKTGSNFVRGSISTVLNKISWSGKLAYDIAVIEVDEAHAVSFVALVQPSGVVALNVMRDQMDRFGEIDTTAKFIGKVVHHAKDFVVLNANDPRIAALQDDVVAKQLQWFGHAELLTPQFLTDDQLHHQENALFYEASKPLVRLDAAPHGHITVSYGGKKTTYDTRIDGTHNAINIAAALAALYTIKPDADSNLTTAALKLITPAFGRGERITLPNDAELEIQLVKNPGGFTHSLRTLDVEPYSSVAIAINDDYADGRDVSWLWDVGFTNIQAPQIITGGNRAADMAVRLKYDNITATEVAATLEELVDHAINVAPGERTVVFCTYTAMLAIRKLLRAKDIVIKEVGL